MSFDHKGNVKLPEVTADELIERIRNCDRQGHRMLVAICGAPGSGKSTLATYVAERLGRSAAVLPMDGFHFENDRLAGLGLLHRKGAPETFDADGFVALLKRACRPGAVKVPTFDRAADRTIPAGGLIADDVRIVLVEGNYLLLKLPPWSQAAQLFDLTVFVDVDRGELERRLIKRWADHGLPADKARERALGNDMINADTVIGNSSAADFIIRGTT
jgi:pantothenate kinase